MTRLVKYIKVWWLTSLAAFKTALVSRGGAVLFIFGKLVRFGFFFWLLWIVAQRTQALAGYNLNQIILFFLTFNLVDIVAQFLFREVYRFRPQIVSGNFDLVLSRPVNPLFRALMGGADVLDLVTIPPLLGLIGLFVARIAPKDALSIAVFVALVLNALVIATAFHIAVLALGVATTAIDHTIMIYRDLTAMGRIPIDFYKEPIRGLLTFAIPVGIMMTIPAKALMGLLEPGVVIYAFLFSAISLWASIKFWNWSLKNYSSASS